MRAARRRVRVETPLPNHERSPEPRCFAIDWSGARTGEKRRIWCAEAVDGRVEALANGRTRRELTQHLSLRARDDAHLVAGFDFAFSFPAWFVRECGARDAFAFWAHVRDHGEHWLARCEPPFWGRPARTRPMQSASRPHYRRTESERPASRGISPKSVFQIGGAGAVGTGSVRGMPELLELRAGGFAIWPFERARFPLALEIYPRFLTGPVTKSNASARAAHLARYAEGQDRALVRAATASEDAFDAFVSALEMSRHAARFARLPRPTDAVTRLEGRIWSPVRDPMPLARE